MWSSFLKSYPEPIRCRRGEAKDLFDTAQLEEKQFNKMHATELYQQVVEQYPNSPYASQAKNRLVALEKRQFCKA